MNYKIVSDSSSNEYFLKDVPYQSVPLRIRTENKEYIDNPDLNVKEMVDDLKSLTSKSSTSCPNAGEWMEAFEGADYGFGVTISSNLSGSYNAACIAKQDFPDKKIEIFDSLSTGAEMMLIIQKIIECAESGITFEQVVDSVHEYQKHTHLLFALESVTNLANNGRINPILAKGLVLIGIRLIGKASDQGTIEVISKARGQKKTIKTLVSTISELGYKGKKLRIDHVYNEELANQLKEAILNEFPSAQIEIGTCKGLCSFYAEAGGLIIGFEDL
ncbi:MAG: DegV family protein [Erysipelotrichaceae bacterium]|uniref:DegV family protein n=1 Tax=Floccifex sp. TaxID=2815810 RepID=UPI002A760760|nr:DegV family protein [Floccifex sp.]MDD7282161.1 DegV family protein [Erysipelotrichaceae bacterium]MDY2959054.1 DegV family protein [Floccifex sp.]